MVHPQHVGQPARRVGLPEPGQVGSERYGIAAAGADCKVGPSARIEVHAEAAGMAIRPSRIARDILVATAPAVRQPTRTQVGQSSKRCPVDGLEVDSLDFMCRPL